MENTFEYLAMGPKMFVKCQKCWVRNTKMASFIKITKSMPAF